MKDDQINFVGIHAEYFVPVYDLADKTRYVTTQSAYSKDRKTSKTINVWLVKAIKGQEQASMLKSLQEEEQNYQKALEQTEKDSTLSAEEKKKKIDHFKHGVKLMQNYIKMYNSNKFQHKPDAEFVDIAKRNLQDINCDVDKSVYLSGIDYYEGR